MALTILWSIWYESQRDVANELIDPRAFGRLPWFATGVVLVALDKFRRKSESEQRVWRIGAIVFGLSLVGLGLVLGPIPLPLIFPLPDADLTSLSVIELILGIPTFILFILSLVTTAVGLQAYTLYLTYRSIRSWWTYVRTV